MALIGVGWHLPVSHLSVYCFFMLSYLWVPGWSNVQLDLPLPPGPLQALLQYSPGRPFQVGFPQPSVWHIDPPGATGFTPSLQNLLQYSPGWPFQDGCVHSGLAQGSGAKGAALSGGSWPGVARPTLHALLQYWLASPFQVGFPQPGVRHVALLTPALQNLVQYSPGCPFQEGFPQPGVAQMALGDEPLRHALLQYSPTLPFHVGFPQPAAHELLALGCCTCTTFTFPSLPAGATALARLG
mmetsp:Transcript_126631/g.370008  ORF Transcript_126631/g.370008 Transcript_126631/m.370008 type:complete len:241 (-) Transcript_126631:41-763(-)